MILERSDDTTARNRVAFEAASAKEWIEVTRHPRGFSLLNATNNFFAPITSRGNYPREITIFINGPSQKLAGCGLLIGEQAFQGVDQHLWSERLFERA